MRVFFQYRAVGWTGMSGGLAAYIGQDVPATSLDKPLHHPDLVARAFQAQPVTAVNFAAK